MTLETESAAFTDIPPIVRQLPRLAAYLTDQSPRDATDRSFIFYKLECERRRVITNSQNYR